MSVSLNFYSLYWFVDVITEGIKSIAGNRNMRVDQLMSVPIAHTKLKVWNGQNALPDIRQVHVSNAWHYWGVWQAGSIGCFMSEQWARILSPSGQLAVILKASKTVHRYYPHVRCPIAQTLITIWPTNVRARILICVQIDQPTVFCCLCSRLILNTSSSLCVFATI